MDMHLRVEVDAEGPVMVKRAAGTPAATDRLSVEAERLARAVHPGVVALAGPGELQPPAAVGAVELRTRYAGEPVETWTGPVVSVAGLGAAVATTLADLHDMGIVHGRLDPTHILIGADGRPRLCGLSGRSDAAPADDVAALAEVLDQLVRRAPPDRWGPLQWSRRPTGDRRALRQVIERALDPVPTRRPTARVFADAILTAVPAAALPEVGGGSRHPAAPTGVVTGAVTGAVTGVATGDGGGVVTGDGAGGGDADCGTDLLGGGDDDTLDRIWPFAHEKSDDERWAEAFGSEPPDLSPAATSHPPVADMPAPAWVDMSDGDEAGSGDLPTRERPSLVGRGGLGGRPRAVATPVATPAHRSRRLVGVGAGTTALVVIAVGVAVTLRAQGGSGVSRGPAGGADPARCPAASSPSADVDGDGCAEALVVDGATVSAGPAQWTLGEPGDLVAIGDWDCDGGASPALLRPATGDVFVFSSWADRGDPVTVSPSQRVEGGVGIRPETTGEHCDRLLIDLAAGGVTAVEVRR